jgi:leucyl-tRNA synthetase
VVIQKRIKQWVFKITKYADRLLEDLKELDWPKKTKLMQENWIGRSEGALISFPVLLNNSKQKEFISVFTTRADTLFGVTYLVIAPEHPLVKKITTKERRKKVEEYIKETAKKSHFEREELADIREKTGVFTGGFALHPLTGERLPIYIADYVIYGYGTGAVMAVPAHDQRDFEFAIKYSLEIKTVVAPSHLRGEDLKNFKVEKEAFTEDGILIHSSEFSGLTSSIARKKIVEKLMKENLGSFSVSYHLRDWIISRQRYWGAPIPIIYCQKCGTLPVPEKDLPVLLPEISDFAPRGVSPLATNPSFLWTNCPKCGQKAQRETDTMDTFICSSWYFYRYCDPKNKQAFASQERLKKWLPVDYYIGGSEHAVMHLLYARFFNKVLYDLGYAPTKEPFLRLRHQGIILGADGYKMSKSRGNVVDPDELVSKYGADSVRTFLMFMGPYEEGGPWNPRGLAGVYRFLNKVIRFFLEKKLAEEQSLTKESLVWRNRTIKKVSQDILGFSFNTAVSALMEWFNYLQKAPASKEDLEVFLKLLSPFAPHLCEELWERLGNKSFISLSPWPAYNENLVEFDKVCYGVLVNGKKRGELRVAANSDAKEVERKAVEIENVKKYLLGKKYKVIFVPGKIINFVV